MSLLELRHITVSLGETAVLRDLSMRIMSGEHTLILGPSGSGKTTLLNVIARLVTPDRGELLLDGAVPKGSGSHYRRSHLGYVLQDLHLLESLTVTQNIALVQAAVGAPPEAPTPEALLSPLGLEERLNTRASVLSRGERQRVALARAFANRPRLVLADEPTSSLDPNSRDDTMRHLWTLCSQSGATALVVSHDQALREDPHFAHRFCLDQGALTSVTT